MEYQGVQYPLKVLAQNHGLSYLLVWTRLYRDGWDLHEALNTPAIAVGHKRSEKAYASPARI